MEMLSETWVQLVMIILGGIAAGGYLRASRQRHLRRASELEGAAVALRAHYEAIEAIADDPAMPIGALEMLHNFSEGISSERYCGLLTDAMTEPFDQSQKDHLPSWFDEIEALRKTRPELASDFFKAIASGLVVAFLRWPGNSWKIARMAAALSLGERKETALAQRVSELNRSRRENDHGGNGASNGGIAVPA